MPNCEEKKCLMCDETYKPNGNRQKYCDSCRRIKQAEFEVGWLKQYRQEHKGQMRLYMAKYYSTHKSRISELAKQRAYKVRNDVLVHYGNGVCACVKCSFDDIRALSIDHIDGGGNKQRKGSLRGSSSFYRWLIVNGYPKGYQTLCMNCQFIKQTEHGEWGSGRPACKKAIEGGEQ